MTGGCSIQPISYNLLIRNSNTHSHIDQTTVRSQSSELQLALCPEMCGKALETTLLIVRITSLIYIHSYPMHLIVYSTIYSPFILHFMLGSDLLHVNSSSEDQKKCRVMLKTLGTEAVAAYGTQSFGTAHSCCVHSNRTQEVFSES